MINEESVSVNKITQDSVSVLRSKAFGGLNEEDVKKYIESIEEKYQKIVKEMKEKTNVISSAKNKLQREYQIYVTKTIEEKKSLQESLDKAKKSLIENNLKTAELLTKIDQLTDEKRELEKILTQASQKIEYLKKTPVTGSEQENNDLKAKIADLEKQIELEKLQKVAGTDLNRHKLEKARILSRDITGFKDEIQNIHLKLETFTEEQAKMNNELQEQLEAEHLRADKAENDLAEFIKSISNLKGKLDSERNMFKVSFKQFIERHDQFQSEITGCFINLQDSCNNYIISAKSVKNDKSIEKP